MHFSPLVPRIYSWRIQSHNTSSFRCEYLTKVCRTLYSYRYTQIVLTVLLGYLSVYFLIWKNHATVSNCRAKSHDISTSELKVCEDGCELVIDTSLVEPMAFNRGSLYQFIGEVNINEKITLRARIACCIDGMDMDLFNQALDIRRKYLQEDTPAVS